MNDAPEQDPVLAAPPAVEPAPVEPAPVAEVAAVEVPEGHVAVEFSRGVSVVIDTIEYTYGAGKQVVEQHVLETIKQTHLADAIVG